MVYALIIGLSLLGIILALLYGTHRSSKRIKDHQEPRVYQFLVQFLLSLLAVFIGAFLGFQLSDYQTELNEKNTVTTLISRSTLELSDEIDTMKLVHEYYSGKSPEEAERRLNANNIQPLFSLNILLNNQSFSKYVSPLSGMLLQQFVRQEEKTRDFINNPSYKLKDRIDGINSYIMVLQDIKLMLSLESDYISKKISYKTLLEKLDSGNLLHTYPVNSVSDNGTPVPLPERP